MPVCSGSRRKPVSGSAIVRARERLGPAPLYGALI